MQDVTKNYSKQQKFLVRLVLEKADTLLRGCDETKKLSQLTKSVGKRKSVIKAVKNSKLFMMEAHKLFQ